MKNLKESNSEDEIRVERKPQKPNGIHKEERPKLDKVTLNLSKANSKASDGEDLHRHLRVNRKGNPRGRRPKRTLDYLDDANKRVEKLEFKLRHETPTDEDEKKKLINLISALKNRANKKREAMETLNELADVKKVLTKVEQEKDKLKKQNRVLLQLLNTHVYG